jgi:hypothetical protein
VLFAVIWVGGGVIDHDPRDPGATAHDQRRSSQSRSRLRSWAEGVLAPVGLVTFLMGIAMINTSWGWGHFWIIAGLIGYASTFIVGIASVTAGEEDP